MNKSSRRLTEGWGQALIPTDKPMGSPTKSRKPIASACSRTRWAMIRAPSGPVFGRRNRNELSSKRPSTSVSREAAKKMPAKVKELHEAMLAWRKKVKAPVPTKLNPGYDPVAAKSSSKTKGKRK